MSSDTGPSELAEIVDDQKKFRTYLVFSQIEIKGSLAEFKVEFAQHRVDDKKNFDYLHERIDKLAEDIESTRASVGAVSSSVAAEKISNRYSLKELAIGFLLLCGALGSLIAFVAWTIGNAGKGSP